jgi:hypothetical protein
MWLKGAPVAYATGLDWVPDLRRPAYAPGAAIKNLASRVVREVKEGKHPGQRAVEIINPVA